MKTIFIFLLTSVVALNINASAVSAGPLPQKAENEQAIRLAKSPNVPTDMYVEPGAYSCVVSWEDEENSAWNLRYRLYSEEPEEPVLLHSLSGSAYTGGYVDITLPAPWGGVNTRGGNGAIYIKNNYNGVATGTLTYTIPEGYNNAPFTLLITSGSGSYGAGNFTVFTPQTSVVGHTFSGGETYRWLVTASSGEKITVYSTDANYSPDIAMIAVYYGDATGAKAQPWTTVNNLDKTTYTIEGLELDTEYEVQVQAIGDDGTVSDWCRSDVFRTLEEEPFVPTVHILGDINDQAWSPFAGTKMEYDPDNELYTATIFVEEGKSFGFTLEIDDNEDMGGWNYINPFRFGPESDSIFSLTNEYLGQILPLSFDNYGDILVLSSGEYKVTVSLEESYIIIEKTGEPVHGYVAGDVNHSCDLGIADVTMLMDLLLGVDEGACVICADVNGDGLVGISDATDLIDILLDNN